MYFCIGASTLRHRMIHDAYLKAVPNGPLHGRQPYSKQHAYDAGVCLCIMTPAANSRPFAPQTDLQGTICAENAGLDNG